MSAAKELVNLEACLANQVAQPIDVSVVVRTWILVAEHLLDERTSMTGFLHSLLCFLCLFEAIPSFAGQSLHGDPRQTRGHHKPSGREEKSFLPRRLELRPCKASVCADAEFATARLQTLDQDSKSQS